MTRRSWRRASADGAAIAALVVSSLIGGLAATAPLWRSPSRRLAANPDVQLMAWELAWVAHQSVHEPARVFDANMFYPHSQSLLYNDGTLALGVMAIPIRALGGNAALSFNLLLLLSFPLVAVGAYALARDFGSTAEGALLAGFAWAYGSYRWQHIVHLQALWIAWLPLGLVFLRRTLRDGRPRDALGFAACALLQALTSGYYLWLMAVAVGAILLFELRARRPARHWLLVLAAAIVAFAGALPELLGRLEIVRRHGFTRSAHEARHWSAAPRSYLDPGPYAPHPPAVLLHRAFGHREHLFPGTAIAALALAGIWKGWRDQATRLLLLLLAAAATLSFGPVWEVAGVELPGSFALLRLLPGGPLLRTPARLGVLALLALAALAALGLSHLLAGRPARRRWLTVAALLAFTGVEGYPSELHGVFREAPAFPASATWLRGAPRGPVLELPWQDEGDAARYLYWSTVHWQPLINGYASFEPPGNFGLGLLGNRWPSEYSARVFRERGIRYVVVHVDRLKQGHRERLLGAKALPYGVRLLASLGSDRIYEIDSVAAATPEKEKPSLREGFPASPR